MTSNISEQTAAEQLAATTESYYDSSDADNFYFNIWGGEDIHIGLYDTTENIAEASRLTVERMIDITGNINQNTRVLDVGAGYGGAARHLVKKHNCSVNCLNISQTQNDTNKKLNTEQGLSEKINVVHGSFEDIPEEDSSFDLVWSQDAILHSGRRQRVIDEVYRVLKPGGLFIFTDPMQADDCPPGVLQAVYDRIHLESLGSFAFYRQAAEKSGFEVVQMINLTEQLRKHYFTVRQQLQSDYDRMATVSSPDYLDRMIQGLGSWVEAADKGYLAWGIMQMRKPG